MKKKINLEHDDELELSPELAELEDANSLEEIRAEEIRQAQASTEDALFSEEELEAYFDETKPAPPVLSNPLEQQGPQDKPYSEALYANDEELEKALDAIEEKEKSPQNEPEAPPADNNDAKPEVVQETEIDLSLFLTAKSRAGMFAQAVCRDRTQLSIVAGGLNDSRLDDFSVSEYTDLQESAAFDKDYLDDKAAHDQALENARHDALQADPESSVQKWVSRLKSGVKHQKARLEEYSGHSLPLRVLPLAFNLPSLKAKNTFDSIATVPSIQKLFALKGTSLNAIFSKADEDLAKLAHCQMSRSQKLRLLRAYAVPLYEKFHSVIALYERRPAVKGDEKRVLMAEHAQGAIKYLILAYKQIYAELYLSTNYIYGPQREQANNIAFELIDLLLMEQRLLMALQIPLPATSIKTFNTLFHALLHYEAQLLQEQRKSLSLDADTRIKEQFLLYQLGLCFHASMLSPTQHKLLHQYLLVNLHLLRFIDPERKVVADTKIWLVAHDHSELPILSAPAESVDKDGFAPVFIDPERFFNKIKSDYAESLALLDGATQEHTCAVCSLLAVQEVVTFLSVLNYCVNLLEAQSQPQTFTIYRPSALRVYAGFNDCADYYRHLYARRNKTGTKPELKDTDSAKLDTKKPESKKPEPGKHEFLCAGEDDRLIYLQTLETKAAIALQVGTLLLMVDTAGESESSMLGLVVSLERGLQGKVSIAVEKLSNEAITVALVIPAVENSQAKSLTAMIALQGEQQFLLAPAEQRFHSDQTLTISMPDDSSGLVRIDALKSISPFVQVLSLQ
jgi:hypothetical protein